MLTYGSIGGRDGARIWGTMIILSPLAPRKGKMTAGEFLIPLLVQSTKASMSCPHTGTYGAQDILSGEITFGSLIPLPIPELKETWQWAECSLEFILPSTHPAISHSADVH